MEISAGVDYERMTSGNYDELFEPSNYSQTAEGSETNAASSGRLAGLSKILSFRRHSRRASEANTEQDAAKSALRKSWRLNYKEAAVYLCEGESNENLNTHPESVTKLKYYFFARSALPNIIMLLTAVALMALALFELPGKPLVDLGARATVSIELCLLAVFVLEMIFRLQSLGGRHCVRNTRFVIKSLFILLMLLDAIVFLYYNDFDLRLCRALRPILLLDCNLLRGSRRFLRQLLETVPRVCLMLVLISFIVLVFSIIAFYMFHTIPKYDYFDSLYNSFLSLTVLLTLANFPDVILPAYYESRWYSVFFVVFMIIEVYILLNFVLAGVYEEFTQIEKDKIKSLFLHRRKACEYAFRKLVTKHDPYHLTLHNYEGLMSSYKPNMNKRDVLLSFKALAKDGRLTIDKFYNVYEVADMKWSQKYEGCQSVWHTKIQNECLRRSFSILERVLSSKCFFWTINVVLLIDATLITIRATVFQDVQQPSVVLSYLTPLLLAFVYAIEIAGRVAVSGRQFFSSGWNIYDFSLVLAICITLPVEMILTWAPYACTLRLLRLLRLLQCHALYRNFVVTLRIIAPRILSAAIVTLCIYYIYAIIGMACFANFNFSDCCQNTVVEEYYSETGLRVGYYFLFNFQDILYAGMTLFTSMAVNDWFIIQEAFAIVAGSDWPAVFFLTFYFTMMVVLSMVISLIVDAFVFRIQCWRFKSEVDLTNNVEVSLSTSESEMCKQLDMGRKHCRRERGPEWSASRFSLADSLEDIGCKSLRLPCDGTDEAVVFVGERKRSPFDFSMQIYRIEVHKWSEEHEKDGHTSLPKLPQTAAASREANFQSEATVSSYPWSSESLDQPVERYDAAKLNSSADTGFPCSTSVETQLVQPSPTGESPLSFWSPPPAPLAHNYSYTMPQCVHDRSFCDASDNQPQSPQLDETQPPSSCASH